ncbi:MAG: FmdE family protein [Anaerolineales bacterium]
MSTLSRPFRQPQANPADIPDLKALLGQSAARHNHLCPRQVLGVRMGLAGAAILGNDQLNVDKSMLVIIETDGCFADGIEVATGCTIGHRTLRLEDYGKVAATFVDVVSGRAVRLVPKSDIRQRAQRFAPLETRRYSAQLVAYEGMPADQLFHTQAVELHVPLETILSRPGARSKCDECGEEIVNEREVERDGQTLCYACSGQAYYRVVSSQREPRLQLEFDRV